MLFNNKNVIIYKTGHLFSHCWEFMRSKLRCWAGFLFSKNFIGGKKGFEPYLFLKEIFWPLLNYNSLVWLYVGSINPIHFFIFMQYVKCFRLTSYCFWSLLCSYSYSVFSNKLLPRDLLSPFTTSQWEWRDSNPLTRKTRFTVWRNSPSLPHSQFQHY